MPDRLTPIGAALQFVCEYTGAKRGLLLHGDRNTHPVKVWINAEYAEGLESVKDRWQGKIADGAYGAMLARCSLSGRETLRTDELKEGTVLRGIYEKAGVVRSEVIGLGHRRLNQYQYLSLNFTEDLEVDEELLTGLALMISRMISRGVMGDD